MTDAHGRTMDLDLLDTTTARVALDTNGDPTHALVVQRGVNALDAAQDKQNLANVIGALKGSTDTTGRTDRDLTGRAMRAAERALRPLKVQQKISGSFRSEAGARNHAALRTMLDTARKQGRNLLETLRTPPEERVEQLVTQLPAQAD